MVFAINDLLSRKPNLKANEGYAQNSRELNGINAKVYHIAA
jgi:hypothetical protein